MKVIKVGGGCLHGKKAIARIVDLIAEVGRGQVFVVSALHGVTDLLIASLPLALESEAHIPGILSRLRARHMIVARELIANRRGMEDFRKDLGKALGRLERLYYGLNFTRELTPRVQDVVSSYGERFSALLLAGILRSRGCPAAYRMPHTIGLITDGKFGDATALMAPTARNFRQHLRPMLKEGLVVFVPGFYGVSESGDITTFGRGGSDYAAAVAAAALEAEVLEIWKDVDGFMSADPKLVDDARLIPELSYEEAAELAYFGAKILHPRSVEPLRAGRIPMAIKNTLNPAAAGSLVTARRRPAGSIIKSVAHDAAIGILKVHASGVGVRPGILAAVSGRLAEAGVNTKSVVTSQTAISLLLDADDLERGRATLMAMRPRPFRRIEVQRDVALIGLVGEGLLRRQGIAARCFAAVAEGGVNVEMISFGPSRAALYFLVRDADLGWAVTAIHRAFFGEGVGG